MLLSTEAGSAIASPVLELIRGAGVPIVPSREVHPDAVRSGGATALMSAAYVGAGDIVHDLVERGAPLDARDTEGFTALMYAAQNGHAGVVKKLVVSGADVTAQRTDGSAAHDFATSNGHERIAAILLSAAGHAS